MGKGDTEKGMHPCSIDSVRFIRIRREEKREREKERYVRVYNGYPGRDHVIGILWSVSNSRNYVQWNKVEKLVIDVS